MLSQFELISDGCLGYISLVGWLSQCTWVLKVSVLETGHTRHGSTFRSDPLRQSSSLIWPLNNHRHQYFMDNPGRNKWSSGQCYFQLSPGGIPPRIPNPSQKKHPKYKKKIKKCIKFTPHIVGMNPYSNKSWELPFLLKFGPVFKIVL